MKSETLTLPRANKWMFQTVRCKAYMRKVRDGKFIRRREKDEIQSGKAEYAYCDNNGERDIQDGEWGGSDFIKTYYVRKESDFVGVVVGMKEIIVKASLYLDTGGGDPFPEYDYVGKLPTETVKCAHVFYGMNRSRYVPFDDIEILTRENAAQPTGEYADQPTLLPGA